MSNIDVIKENIQFEQLLRESDTTTMLNEEYLIPDTHPDVHEILMVDAKPTILSKEISGDKVIVDGTVDYNLLYLAKEDELVVSSVNYTQKFSSDLDLDESEHKITCEVCCNVEHIETKIINERKVSIDGVLNFNWEMYKNKEVELIKDVDGTDEIEVLKKNEIINSTDVNENVELAGKSLIRVSMDKPQVSRILKSKLELQKKEIKVLEEKIYCGCYCKVFVLYLSNEGRDIQCLEDNVYISKEVEMPNVTSDMIVTGDYDIKGKDVTVEEDDLGESRLVNTEITIACNVKAFSKKSIDVVTDAYSPKVNLELSKNSSRLGILEGVYNNESIVKDNIYINENNMMPDKIITAAGDVVITEKSVEENKIMVGGYIRVNVIYKTNDESKYLDKVSGDIPFNISIDASGVNERMKALVKAAMENLDVSIEANTIAVRCTLVTIAKVLYEVEKNFVNDIVVGDGEEVKKKSSITIYVVGKGDTLWELAKRYRTTMDDIIKLNELEDPDSLVPGQKLLIPGRAM
ncbi:SPOCS domain-containing protein [Clostridium baratii]|uniref:DUF3794 and LysM peptidoglycan-binding domain-containing protein n=1 Tax=Clostridium baratii TaxID=1561 RepID=UPI002A749D2E|nr:SPOCS domain-containing protein [Clostridium baratii]MDY3206096.1 DUF3794 domain-containing protein [Clostridium baratii]